MSSEISLEKIGPSYWKTKDKEWVEQRQAQWPAIERVVGPARRKSIGQWDAKGTAKGNINLHKQFLLDRAAASEGQARRKDPDDGQYKKVEVASNFKWRFQKFKVSPPKATRIETDPLFGQLSEKDSIYYGMNQSVGQKKDYADLNWGTGNFSSKEHVEHASLQKFLAALTKIGFKEAADALLEEPAEALSD